MKSYTRNRTALTVTTAIIGSIYLAAPVAAQVGTNTSSLEHSVVLSNLDSPWDMAFLEDGTMFFTEKCNGLSVMMPSGEVNQLLGMEESEGYATTAQDLLTLHQKLGGPNAVGASFDIATALTTAVGFDARVQLPQTVKNAVVEIAAVDEGFNGIQEMTAAGAIAGCRGGLQPGVAFPGSAFGQKILFHRCQ